MRKIHYDETEIFIKLAEVYQRLGEPSQAENEINKFAKIIAVEKDERRKICGFAMLTGDTGNSKKHISD